MAAKGTQRRRVRRRHRGGARLWLLAERIGTSRQKDRRESEARRCGRHGGQPPDKPPAAWSPPPARGDLSTSISWEGKKKTEEACIRAKNSGRGGIINEVKGDLKLLPLRLLPNGDFYTGLWTGNLPHGGGKYLWTDGCMYEGEWSLGKTTGKGKFSWPSGATYEGEFKAGFMDGFGTYTGAAGDTYPMNGKSVLHTKQVRFVIMGNLFCSEYSIHRRFDLKGSSHGRTTDKPEDQIDETTTLKDLDLNFLFRLQRSWFQEFQRQVDRDCEFLEQERIMDYSLLVGLHFREAATTPGDHQGGETSLRSDQVHRSQPGCFLYSTLSSITGCPDSPLTMSGSVEQTQQQRSEGESPPSVGETFDVVLFFGIIDILQDYDISKKLEHAYKSIQYDPTSISAVDPKQYSRRFRDFIFKVFREDP
ncbi:unnamed protein product [Spirodela intermedia]|uniref:1-phosphatidylinositol-4-phosphate 5-kinase n=1 Tax=Spirodela intermedia TaxID=51605 RepID=A0A7I8I8P5_SPIIN|nr:unnamed protein product [Spirodela intermedia]CAA6654025.1 unnamed protein product [Spirodela intermedia]